ncbi:MAG: carbohydrate kinase family protein [Crenarchaeota archaeon]|nr:carbohydrate kinase family protein [Thermoproteota archaeon]
MDPPRHLAVGNINVDMYLVVPRLPGPDEAVAASTAYVGPGGAASNYAVAASRAGHRSSLLAHTGRLALSLGVLEALERSGVDVSLVRVHEDELPGIAVVLLESGGQRAMVKLVGANRLLTGDEELGGGFDVAHVASVHPRVALRVASRRPARLHSYDPGGAAPQLRGHVEELRGLLDVLYVNRVEFRKVFGVEPSPLAAAEAAARLEAIVVVKLGGDGALAASPRGDLLRVEAIRVEAVDTTGAGDVFDAYMNAWLAEGRSLGEALQAAAVAAGLKVARRGAQSAPSRREVEERLQRGPPRLQRL